MPVGSRVNIVDDDGVVVESFTFCDTPLNRFADGLREGCKDAGLTNDHFGAMLHICMFFDEKLRGCKRKGIPPYAVEGLADLIRKGFMFESKRGFHLSKCADGIVEAANNAVMRPRPPASEGLPS